MMKKIIEYTLGSMLAFGVLASCTGKFEEFNTSDITVDPNTLPLSAQCLEPMAYCYPPHQNMFQFWGNLSLDFYCGYFMTPNGNFTNGDLGKNRGHSGGMHENFYLHIFNNTRRIIAANEAAKPGVAAVMKIVQSLGAEMTTDTYGPIAYSSILSGENEVVYHFDSQQKIYETILADLKDVISTLEKVSDADKQDIANFDIWCGGDVNLWIKVANTMRLRIALKLSKRESEMKAAGFNLPEIAKEAAANTLANGGKDIVVTGQSNELKRMFEWGDTAPNAFIITLMDGYNDPRLPLYFTKNAEVKQGDKVLVEANKGYYGIRIGSGLPGKPNPWGSFSQWTGSYNTPLPIFKQAESYFLLAEAAVRGWISGDAKSYYEDGIKTSIKNEIAHNIAVPADLIEAAKKADVNAYINGTSHQKDFKDPVDDQNSIKATVQVPVKWESDKEKQLEQIMTQKFIAVFPLSYVTWSDSRRTGYPRLFPARINESQGAVKTEEGVRRQVYSDNEGSTNLEALNAGIEILMKENSSTWSKGDTGGTRVWWDVEGKSNF